MTQYVLLLGLIMYLLLHSTMYPFKHIIVNRVESICVFLVIMGLATIIFGFDTQLPEIVSLIMAVIILIPCIIIAICVILFIDNYRMDKKNLKSGNIKSNTKINARINGMKSRLTKTQRDLFKSNAKGRSHTHSPYSHQTMDDGDTLDKDYEMERNIQTGNTISPANGISIQMVGIDKDTEEVDENELELMVKLRSTEL